MKKIAIIIGIFYLAVSLWSYDFQKDLEKKYNLKSETDKKKGITWYKHKNSVNTNSRIYLYFGVKNKNNQLILRMVISHYAGEKLFIKEYKFNIDGKEYILTPREKVQTIDTKESLLDRDTEVTESRGVCEIYDVMINQEEFNLLQEMSKAKIVKLRYDGVKGYKKVAIHDETKEAIGDVIKAIIEVAEHIKEKRD